MAYAPASSPGLTIIRILVGILELWVAAIVIILGLSLVMHLLGANPAGFTNWIYDHAANLANPFNGIFPDVQLTERMRLQSSVLFAMFVYAIAGALLGAIARRFA